MRVLFCGQVPKDLDYAEANEDAAEISSISGRLAISDGASESYDSKSWARLIVDAFVQNPIVDLDWVTSIIDRYSECFDLSSLSWSKTAAFERGSFATLLGIEFSEDARTINVLSVGDSLAVLLDGSELVDSHPYGKAEDFLVRPELISTRPVHNSFVSDAEFLPLHQKRWQLTDISNPVLLCMTDALGEWALRNADEEEQPWGSLAEIRDNSELEALVTRERGAHQIRVDDVTLVIVSFNQDTADELPDA